MARVAVVEDEELIRTMLRLNLEKQGYQVECFVRAEELLDRLAAVFYDIILLDIMLPGMSGEELVGQIRRRGVNTPVLMVTAKSDIPTKVSTLGRGADDYLAKPFHMEELLARVQALIRRSQGERAVPSHQLVRVGPWEVNLETREADTRQGAMKLSEKECDLLALFARNPRVTLSRADILDEVWGMDADPTPRTVDNFIVRLRKLFEANPEAPEHFITVHAAGYRFDP